MIKRLDTPFSTSTPSWKNRYAWLSEPENLEYEWRLTKRKRKTNTGAFWQRLWILSTAMGLLMVLVLIARQLP